MIEYKGYVGVFEYDPEEEEFHGRIVNLQRDGATFVGRSVEELKREMAASVDDLIAFSREQGIQPEKPSPFTELDRLRYMVESAQARLAEHPDAMLQEHARPVAALRAINHTHDVSAFKATLAQAAATLLSHHSVLTPQPLGASSFDYLHSHRVSFSHTPEVGSVGRFRLPGTTAASDE